MTADSASCLPARLKIHSPIKYSINGSVAAKRRGDFNLNEKHLFHNGYFRVRLCTSVLRLSGKTGDTPCHRNVPNVMFERNICVRKEDDVISGFRKRKENRREETKEQRKEENRKCKKQRREARKSNSM
jgi:hypothetical protein